MPIELFRLLYVIMFGDMHPRVPLVGLLALSVVPRLNGSEGSVPLILSF